MKRTFPLHVHIGTLFMVMIMLVGAIIAGVGFRSSREMLQSAANDTIVRIGGETRDRIEGLVASAEQAINMASYSSIVVANSLDERMSRVPLLREALASAEAVSSIYAGYDNGDFFFLRRVRDAQDRAAFNAPEGTRYIVQSIVRAPGRPPQGRFIFLDGTLATLRTDDRPDYAASYDPRTRDWYKAAMTSGFPIKTEPYLFVSDRKVGSTLARGTTERGVVVGADILLDTLGLDLKRRKATPATEMALVNGQGLVLAHEDLAKLVGQAGVHAGLNPIESLGRPALAAAAPMLKEAAGGRTASGTQSIEGEDWSVSVSPLVLTGTPLLFLVIAIPERELLAAAHRLRTTSIAVTVLVVLLSIPVIWLMARAVSGPLRALLREAEAIRRFEFSGTGGGTRSIIKEVDQLSITIERMKRTIRRFLEVSAAVAGEQDFGLLLPMLLRETLSSAEADFGILYLADVDGLIPMSVLDRDGGSLKLGLLPVLFGDAGPLLGKALSEGSARTGLLDPADVAAIGLQHLTEPHHAVAVPLRNREQQTVGAMLILSRIPVGRARVSFIGALAASTASSLETRELIAAQKELFEAFIQLIASAIDAKSPYTGGHCARVPELTKMLARAACEQTSGPFKDFDLTEQEWEGVHIASWLHDCGKVTTPEYVVDKATKLETLYDRIHEVRMRFEVLKRDAEIEYWRAVASGGDPALLAAQLEGARAALDDDFAFVAACNEGGEFMAAERVERLKAIAARTWQRTLDDRIGISHEENERKARSPAVPLPVVEPLLADKPEHRFDRRPQERMPEDNQWGFRMKVPDLLYNKGEVYNLSVGRGTLSEEERYKINEHIVQTLIMLSALPFPKHLRQVPEIAGGHHEKMDGTGYPKGLVREQMSPLARMMAIADIFEALTAVDRPYKKGKTLSEALKIMSFMKKDQHVDPDLFDLFLTSGVYLEYARQFMKPEQIDAVDPSVYVTRATA